MVRWKQYGALLGRYLGVQRGKAVVLGMLLLVGIGLQLLNPQILRHFIDAVKGGESLRALASTAWVFLLVSLCSQACTATVAYLGADVGWVATNRLRNDLALHCLRLDMPFHQMRTPGEMIERVDGDVNTLANFFSQFLVTVIGNVVLLLGVLVLLFREDWRVGAALALFSLIAGVVLVLVRNFAVPAMKAERECVAQSVGFAEERFSGLEDIRANGMGAHVLRGYNTVLCRLFHASRKASMTRNGVWLITMTLFMLGNLAALLMGASLYFHHAITLGTVYLFVQYNTMLRSPLEELTRQMQDLQEASASILRIGELLEHSPTILDGPQAVLPDGPLGLEFDHVSFSYIPEEPVLQELSFSLAPGRVLGLLGRTGSGKSTITRLLFRLYDVEAGEIRVGGEDVRQLKLAELRRRIGLVTQEVQLFHASVRDNLTFFDRSIPDERIRQVITELGLEDWFATLPDGLDTMLQAGGSGLSAGESQLLAFTRIFLANPALVLLDEPSSRLDPATERLIERGMDRLLRGRTCVIIAHRLSTVRHADDILILEKGRIAEYGPRAALAENPASHFAHLLRTGMEKELA